MDFNTEYLRAASGEEVTSCYISSQVEELTWLNSYTGASLVAQMVKKLPVMQLNSCTNRNAQGTGGCSTQDAWQGYIGLQTVLRPQSVWLRAVCMDLSDSLLS